MSDKDLWEEACSKEATIILDNDETYVDFSDGGEWISFHDSIGNSPGIPVLLEMLGLRVEGV